METIGILRETKQPLDRRAPLAPREVAMMVMRGIRVIVQPSKERCYSDEEYQQVGAIVQEDISECDYLFCIKEIRDYSLFMPDKAYFFFGHISERRTYEHDMLRAMVKAKSTFVDYDDIRSELYLHGGPMSYYAGVEGAYHTLRLYDLKEGNIIIGDTFKYILSYQQQMSNIRNHYGQRYYDRCQKIVITGTGVAAAGASHVLRTAGFKQVSNDYFEKAPIGTFTIVSGREARNDFNSYRKNADILISCHDWDEKTPAIFTLADAAKDDTRIRVIGDVTADINGSIETTLRHSTADAPYYDVSGKDGNETPLFSNKDDISVLAVSNLPTGCPIEATDEFSNIIYRLIIARDIIDKKATTWQTSAMLTSGYLSEKYKCLEHLL